MLREGLDSAAAGGVPTPAQFSHIFVDEAGQALLPEVMVPLSLRCPGRAHVLLAGDPK